MKLEKLKIKNFGRIEEAELTLASSSFVGSNNCGKTSVIDAIDALLSLKTEKVSEADSRMKDFYDVYILLKNNTIDNNSLQEAIDKTFRQRNTVFVENHELFTNSFCENKNRQMMWKAFLRKIRISEELDFSNVMNAIVQRLYPIYKNILI